MQEVAKNLHVLICDPNKEKNRELIRVLKEFDVRSAQAVGKVEDVVGALERQRPNVVIIGDQFTNIRVDEVMDYLKIEPALKELPILLHTASEDKQMIQALVEKGLTGVIPNPPDVPSVRTALRNYCRRVKSVEITKLVQESPFFADFTTEEMKITAKLAIPRKYQVGETIFQKGDPGDKLYILLSGQIETMVMDATGRSVNIRINAGQPFGEMAILDQSPRSAFCIASEDAIVLEVGSHILEDTDSRVRLKIFAKLATVLAERLRYMNDMVQHQETASEPAQREPSEIEGEEAPDLSANPFTVPQGKADRIDPTIEAQEEYDVLKRKINLRTDFVVAKVPKQMAETIANKLFGYWTGGKLAKVNPHALWNPKSFNPGSPRLKQAMHMVVVCPQGLAAYTEAYLGLPFSHRVIGMSDVGCCGSFLGSEKMIDRFLGDQQLEEAIKLDLEIPIDRTWRGQDVIEFLTHTTEDVRPQTLFLLFDTVEGTVTRRFREKFPEHQMITIIPEYSFRLDDPPTFFTMPEEKLKAEGHISSKADYKGKGFYAGQTLFLPDISELYANTDKMRHTGFIFGTIGIFAQMGPDYSGVTWGSSGGAEGAARAARAMFGTKGAQTAAEIASAISWADN